METNTLQETHGDGFRLVVLIAGICAVIAAIPPGSSAKESAPELPVANAPMTTNTAPSMTMQPRADEPTLELAKIVGEDRLQLTNDREHFGPGSRQIKRDVAQLRIDETALSESRTLARKLNAESTNNQAQSQAPDQSNAR